MVAILPARHSPQPSPGLGDGVAHSIPEFFFDLLELRPDALADRLPEPDEFTSGPGREAHRSGLESPNPVLLASPADDVPALNNPATHYRALPLSIGMHK